MKRVFLILAMATLILSRQEAYAQNNQQIIDSLQQVIENLQHNVDTATIINGLKGHINYLDKSWREATDQAVVLSETKAKFQGNDANTFSAWVNKHLKQQFDENNNQLEGRVTISFVVSQTGEVTNVKVIRGVHPKLDQEALRVVSSSPKWTPGTSFGTPISTTYFFPVVFQAH